MPSEVGGGRNKREIKESAVFFGVRLYMRSA